LESAPNITQDVTALPVALVVRAALFCTTSARALVDRGGGVAVDGGGRLPVRARLRIFEVSTGALERPAPPWQEGEAAGVGIESDQADVEPVLMRLPAVEQRDLRLPPPAEDLRGHDMAPTTWADVSGAVCARSWGRAQGCERTKAIPI